MRNPKPKQWSVGHASMFKDESVAAAYPYRLPYPPATIDILLGLLPVDGSRVVLDAGCGPGPIARALAPSVDRVDAIDFSEAMVRRGRALPNGDHENLHWICSPVETAPLQPAYSLIVAAASVHWMDWYTVLPRFANHLNEGGFLAIIEALQAPRPWDAAIGKAISECSRNRDFQPYTMLTVARELEQRGLFQQHGVQETDAMAFHQPVAQWIASFHARNGLSQERMGLQAARTFDRRLERLIQPYAAAGVIELHVRARVIWGRPMQAPGAN